eukprot:TRINITY_DN2991_c0_g1_i1.p1 TRINITY_DN2991_c0_g1~~TRINITY_DN2991_c0_g1_i1.p1  ORF type:complete len:343 (+),score=69.68 TRINITY_DN2991_c0_g1_i1:20-1048(+)
MSRYVKNQIKQQLSEQHNTITQILNEHMITLNQSVENTCDVLNTMEEEIINLTQQKETLLQDIHSHKNQLNILKEGIDEYTLLQSKIDEEIEKAKSKVKLNVGGTVFMTSKKTLVSREASYFYGLLSSEFWGPDEDGEYFIDRDPIVFDRVLNYMRYGYLDMKGLSDREKDMLREDMDYYCLECSEDPSIVEEKVEIEVVDKPIINKVEEMSEQEIARAQFYAVAKREIELMKELGISDHLRVHDATSNPSEWDWLEIDLCWTSGYSSGRFSKNTKRGGYYYAYAYGHIGQSRYAGFLGFKGNHGRGPYDCLECERIYDTFYNRYFRELDQERSKLMSIFQV